MSRGRCSLFVLFDLPPVDRPPHVIEAHEQVGIEQFLAQRAVESFDIGVLVRFAGLDVLDSHASRLCPIDEGFPTQGRCRCATPGANPSLGVAAQTPTPAAPR